MLEAFFVKNHNVERKKELQKIVQKKVTPLTQTGHYDPGPALPGSPPRVRGFLNKKQLSEQETTTAAPVIWHALGQGPASIDIYDIKYPLAFGLPATVPWSAIGIFQFCAT